MRNGWNWIGWGVVVGLTSFPAWSAEPDPEAVRRLMEKYEREAAEEAAKQAPAPKPRPKPEPASKPQPKPAPRVDHDREAWQSAEKCGTAACFRAYLEDYPKGRYARMARARLEPESDTEPAVVTERPTPAARRTDRRFTDNGNGTVTDNHSGLIWLKNANCFDRQDWSTAMTLARRLSSGDCGLRDGSGAGQWRLPNLVGCRSDFDRYFRVPYGGQEEEFLWPTNTWLT